MAPTFTRVNVLSPAPPWRSRLATGMVRLAIVNCVLPEPPLIVALARGVPTLMVWPAAVIRVPAAVMALSPGAPLTTRLLTAAALGLLMVTGPARLYGQRMSSPDIRAGMAMVIAALCAEGTSTIGDAYQIDKGYERIDERLRALGAHIERTHLQLFTAQFLIHFDLDR